MEDSILELRASVAQARDKGNLKELAQAQVSLVKISTVQMMTSGSIDSSSLEEAVQMAREAVKNAANSQDPLTEALGWNSVGQLLALGGETSEPLRCFERALAIYVRIGDHKGAATCCSGLAGICIKTGDLSRASEVLRQGIRYSTQAGDLEAVERHKLALRQVGGLQTSLGSERVVGTSPGLFGWYIRVLKNYVGISGRASRAEFWSFTAVNILVFFVLAFIEGATGINNDPNVFVLGGLYNLTIILPTLAVTVRRLHDIGQSGWCVLINAIPIVGWLIVLVMLAQKGEDGTNAYGDPETTS